MAFVEHVKSHMYSGNSGLMADDSMASPIPEGCWMMLDDVGFMSVPKIVRFSISKAHIHNHPQFTVSGCCASSPQLRIHSRECASSVKALKSIKSHSCCMLFACCLLAGYVMFMVSFQFEPYPTSSKWMLRDFLRFSTADVWKVDGLGFKWFQVLD